MSLQLDDSGSGTCRTLAHGAPGQLEPMNFVCFYPSPPFPDKGTISFENGLLRSRCLRELELIIRLALLDRVECTLSLKLSHINTHTSKPSVPTPIYFASIASAKSSPKTISTVASATTTTITGQDSVRCSRAFASGALPVHVAIQPAAGHQQFVAIVAAPWSSSGHHHRSGAYLQVHRLHFIPFTALCFPADHLGAERG